MRCVYDGDDYSCVSNEPHTEGDGPQSSSAGSNVGACQGKHAENPELLELVRY